LASRRCQRHVPLLRDAPQALHLLSDRIAVSLPLV
jgi:hypothetical protein